MNNVKKVNKVMSALKGRDDVGSKKGVSLLSIVQKLTENRKTSGDNIKIHEKIGSPDKIHVASNLGKIK